MQETELRLTDELVEVCKDYCKEVCLKAFNLVGVPADSKWREARNIYYPSDIREILADLPSSLALATLLIEQTLTTEAPPPPLEVSKDSNQVSDQGQGVEKAEVKEKGKEVQASSEAKYAAKANDIAQAKNVAKAKDVATKVKEAEDKSKDTTTAKDVPVSKPDNKEDPPPSSKA